MVIILEVPLEGDDPSNGCGGGRCISTFITEYLYFILPYPVILVRMYILDRTDDILTIIEATIRIIKGEIR